jgi:hypothetical protein
MSIKMAEGTLSRRISAADKQGNRKRIHRIVKVPRILFMIVIPPKFF